MKLKIGTKINVMFFSVLIGFSVVIAILVNNQVTDGIKQFAVEKAKSDLQLGYSYLDASIPGAWRIENDKMYKGDVLLNDNFDVVDKIGEDTGGTVTIFQGDTRITTNVMVDGERAVGTQVSDVVAEAVLKNEDTYYGEADVAGNIYQAAYRPIIDANNNVIGIFYVGAPQGMIVEIVKGIIKSLVIVLVIVLVIAGVISTIFTNRIKRRMAEVKAVLHEASRGDFTHKLSDKTGDELTDVSESYNMMAASIQNVVKEITQDAVDVSQSSTDLLSISQESKEATVEATQAIKEIVGNVNQQKAMIEQSAQAVNEVTMAIGEISENTAAVADASQQTIDKALAGQQSVDNVVKQMTVIYESNSNSNEVIRDLEGRSQEIGNIVDAITAISDQTNLLALNASIEAARAGEHGKGFAVVADEVRKLAEQSHGSATMIATIVQSIQTDTSKVAQLMSRTHGEIENGIAIVKETGDNFTDIYESIAAANGQIQQLTSISEEMAASMEEINASFDEVSHLANETAEDATKISEAVVEQQELTEDVTKSATQLSHKSVELKEVVAKFKVE